MLKPGEFVAGYDAVAKKKTDFSTRTLLLLGILAGFYIGMGGAVTNTAAHAIENVSVAKLLCGALFPVGLFLVLITGAELFTGNCLITMPLLSGRTRLFAMMRNLCLVYLGNLLGAMGLAAACVYGGQLGMSGGGLAVYTMKVAATKCALPFGPAVVLGILCNILVCAGVVCALCARDVTGRAVGAFLPVCFFVVCGFEHCVANMYYIPAGLFAQAVPQYAALAAQSGLDLTALSWSGFFLGNLLPVTLGNLLGGCGFAALLWACYGDAKIPAHP